MHTCLTFKHVLVLLLDTWLGQGSQAAVRVQGPEYTFTVSGGYCTLDKDTKSVTCVKPEVTLEKTAGTCTLKYTSPTTAFVSPLLLLLPNVTVTIQTLT